MIALKKILSVVLLFHVMAMMPLRVMADDVCADTVGCSSEGGMRAFHVAMPLVGAGAAMSLLQNHFSNLPVDAGSKDKFMGQILRVSPTLAMIAVRCAGVEGQERPVRVMEAKLCSYLAVMTLAGSLKYVVNERRPDGSGRNSFPSGHVATSFASAAILDRQYGGVSPWYSILGYGLATCSAAERICSNSHWTSDVIAGAGIGILSADIGYVLRDVIFGRKGGKEFDFHQDEDSPFLLGGGFGGLVPQRRYFEANGSRVHLESASWVSADASCNVRKGLSVGLSARLLSTPFTKDGIYTNGSVLNHAQFVFRPSVEVSLGKVFATSVSVFSGYSAGLGSADGVKASSGFLFGADVALRMRVKNRVSYSLRCGYERMTLVDSRSVDALSIGGAIGWSF